MKKHYLFAAGLMSIFISKAQNPEINSWMLNTTGTQASYWEESPPMSGNYVETTMTDSANILQVCFTNDTVWVRTHGITTDMGIYTNPGAPTAQDFTYKFPRNPQEATVKEDVPVVFAIGILTNGVGIFGISDGMSWDNSSQSTSGMGQDIWHGEAYYTEGMTLDTAFAAHPQQQGFYHTHATPYRLYTDPSTNHSPIVGYANDGFPIYGPFGYSNPTDANSGITRIVPSYQLRNISVRHELADGTVLNPSEYGPDVSGTYPLGYFIEDYEYVQGLGDLDEYNGRFCVTPDYPAGTYAYFVGTDSNGDPAFPYYCGEQYYGTPEPANNSPANTTTIPGMANCVGDPTSVEENTLNAEVYPNPVSNHLNVILSQQANNKIEIFDQFGKLCFAEEFDGINMMIDLSELKNAIYTLRISNRNGVFVKQIVINK